MYEDGYFDFQHLADMFIKITYKYKYSTWVSVFMNTLSFNKGAAIARW